MNQSWNATTITANAPNSGQLVVTRDNGGVPGKSSVVGIYVTVGGGGADPCRAAAGASRPPSTPRPPARSIIVEPGTYSEMVILYKNIRLQGAGAGVTNINAFKVPAEKLQTWRQKVEALRVAGSISLLDGQATGLNTFATEYGPGVIVLGTADLAMNSARIDGFTHQRRRPGRGDPRQRLHQQLPDQQQPAAGATRASTAAASASATPS